MGLGTKGRFQERDGRTSGPIISIKANRKDCRGNF
jgi:hypothetical protein